VESTNTRPPFVGDERTLLIGWYDLQRSLVTWKCDGLSEDDAHRVVLPTSPLMTVAGIVSHLRWAEQTWYEVLFLGGPDDGPQFTEDPEDADMIVDGVPLAQLLDDYTAQCARSNEIIAAHSLDEVGRHPDYQSSRASLRWMVIHMIEETARHVGHLDIIREQLDGAVGYY
jgi:hypothetical protein